MATFSVTVQTLAGEKKVDGLSSDMILREFRRRISQAFDFQDFELLIMLEGNVLLPAEDWKTLDAAGRGFYFCRLR